MIVCKKCTFEVSHSMRHSLIKNCCPSCGSALLGEVYTQRLRLLRERLLTQQFAQDLGADVIFDMTLFMLTEFFNTTPEAGSSSEPPPLPGSEDEADSSEADSEETYDDIRDAVRAEAQTAADDDPSFADSDIDLKVARLKRVAKETGVTGTGPSVRRVAD